MKARYALSLFALGFSFLCPAAAQSPEDTLHTPDFIARDAFNSILIPPLTNSPFTATINAEWTRQSPDEVTTTLKNHRLVIRDAKGRIYQERRRLTPDGDVNESALMQIEISDPETHIKYFCDPYARVCVLRNYFMAAVTGVPPVGPLDEQGARYLSRENLGEETILDLRAIGTRETVTTSAGVQGNDGAVNVTKEFWYSPQLGLNLSVKRIDPLHGTQSVAVTAIRLQAPDPRLFTPPAGYKVVDERNPDAKPPQTPGR